MCCCKQSVLLQWLRGNNGAGKSCFQSPVLSRIPPQRHHGNGPHHLPPICPEWAHPTSRAVIGRESSGGCRACGQPGVISTRKLWRKPKPPPKTRIMVECSLQIWGDKNALKTTTLNVLIRHVDPSERLSTSEHDVSTFHYILLPPNPRDEPLERVCARVCFGPQWIPLKSKSELKLKLPVCYFHETSPLLFQIPLMYQQLLFLFSFLFISFFPPSLR